MTDIFNNLIRKNSKRAFTVLEMMITVFVLAVALVGGMTALQKTATLTSISSDRLIAAYLAQEGLEIIRNIRDGNWLEGLSWGSGLGGCDTQCVVDYNMDSPRAPFSDDEKLRFDLSGKVKGYQHDKGNETKFQRKITITEPNPNILNVSVEVIWTEKGVSKSFSAQENLYNWR